ncbi:YwmB family TATA-box binding protein [Paenibacillus sp. MER 99-2]|uniref:YwmB family TATA-box binding protein n=1 Tax=Paenibacillus sp. MER 99-2 TaxID=2939572 RepID=UPI00203DB1DA|nr:YwmB family TATA-box binding protein [Paenibacillus sp. MER 99-2]MCM3175841.1 YwmB family TATA-box binding protein [Paenibacillus sp. MER 99-2]
MLKRWMMTAVLAVVIIMLIGITQVYAEKSVSEGEKLEQMLNTAGAAIEQVDRLVLKWQGQGKGDAQEIASLLADELQLEKPELVRQTGHDVYRSELKVSNEGVGILVNVVVTGEAEYYTIIQLSGDEESDMSVYLHLHEQVERLLKEVGIKATWNFSVQGTGEEAIVGAENPNNVQVQAITTVRHIEGALSDKLKLSAVEHYEDASTTSVSYVVPELSLAVNSGLHQLNMQLAVHQDDVLGTNRVTMGFPLITIEY